MPRRLSPVALAAIALGLIPAVVQAEMTPSLNYNGVAGLIDMPSGDAMPDGTLGYALSNFGPVTRGTLSFQITPRLSGSFRYSAVRDLNLFGFNTYYDRSFDLRYQVLQEGRYLPALSIGLQDFAGTGLFAAEYLAATKTFGDRVKVTAGLGWGRLGSNNPIGSPFGVRPPAAVGLGGKPNPNTWFRGPAAPFAGVEWQVNDRLRLKAEYSSDAYVTEAGAAGPLDLTSPFNFGLEYKITERATLGAHALYGSNFGLNLTVVADPRKPVSELRTRAPGPVVPRDRQLQVVGGWPRDWMGDPARQASLRSEVTTALAYEGIGLEGLSLSADRAELRIRDDRFDSRPNALGRAARVLAAKLPPSVEEFRIVPMVQGMPTVAVTVRRTDLELLETAPDAVERLWAATRVEDAARLAAVPRPEGLYPRFRWNFGPYVRASYFDPRRPIRLEGGLRARASYEITPQLTLSGSVRHALTGNLKNRPPIPGTCNPAADPYPPNVRTDSPCYDREGTTGVESLTVAYRFRPGQNLYGRVTAGYLEPMYAGVSGEVLWQRPESRLALGVELNYVKKRDYDMLFGLQDYSVLTGHASAYYDLGRGFTAQLDVGRYLAGDVGATLSLDRRFDNGFRVGAFATMTNMSFADFGEGSFDKGIRVEIPVTWLTGEPSQTTYGTTLRPVLRDGGARVAVSDRLYESLRRDTARSYAEEWGRFWR